MQFLLLFSLNTLLSLFQFDGWRADIEQPKAKQEVLCVGVRVKIKVFLEGPYKYDALVTPFSTMKDNLRTRGTITTAGYAANGSASLIPLTEPYTAITGFTHSGGGGGEIIAAAVSPATIPAVIAVTGDNAIIDWVFIELRDPTTPTTILATRSALLQVDGDVVDVDGISPVTFATTNCGSFNVAIRHRTHLGIRTNSSVALTNDVNTTALVDFTAASPSHGVFQNQTYAPRKTLSAALGNALVMYAGNVIHQNTTAPYAGLRQLQYSGSGNDRGPILSRIGSVDISATIIGYYPEDVNLDATVKYSGSGNDRGIILVNIGSIDISALLVEQL